MTRRSWRVTSRSSTTQTPDARNDWSGNIENGQPGGVHVNPQKDGKQMVLRSRRETPVACR